MSEESDSEQLDGWQGALRRLGDSSTPERSRAARDAGSTKRTAESHTRRVASESDDQARGVAGNVGLLFGAFATLIWVAAFVGALARGDWAFAVLALILGSLSGFWLSTGLLIGVQDRGIRTRRLDRAGRRPRNVPYRVPVEWFRGTA